MQPALFVSHGAPTLPVEPSPVRDFLLRLGRELPEPRAILAISAHWETASPRITASAAPRTIHDFRGFGPELERMTYPAPGHPALARHVRDVLVSAGLHAELDEERGLDHGVWTPLLLLRPEARTPVIAVSLQPRAGELGALRLGQALAPLLAEGVLVMASGSLTHGLPEFRANHGLPGAEDHAAAYSCWVASRVADADLPALLNWRDQAPEALRNHPTDEHWLPLFVAMGAGGVEGARRLHASFTHRVLAMDVYAFGGGQRLSSATSPVRN